MEKIPISFTGVSKSYGRHQVLKNINLQVAAGEFVGLIGVNGAGKTTLIKCLLDFIYINSGSISIFGKEHVETSARKKLTFLPENFIPPYYLTGMDFLEYMADLYRIPCDTDKIARLTTVLDLDQSALKKPVRQLSKGMSQKLGLLACMLSDRELLILDEPMSGLDPRARAYLKRYLLELKSNEKTLFFSTHMLTDVESLCEKVAILHKGSIKFYGSTEACCNNYNADNFEQAYLNCVESAQ